MPADIGDSGSGPGEAGREELGDVTLLSCAAAHVRMNVLMHCKSKVEK